MNINQMNIGKTYSFSTNSTAFLGSRIEQARLIAMGDIKIAETIAPVKQLYAQIFPSLPAGNNYSPNDRVYYIFEQLNGQKIVLADQWIVEGSVELIERVVYSVKIYDGNLGDYDKIKAALAAIGKTNVVIEF